MKQCSLRQITQPIYHFKMTPEEWEDCEEEDRLRYDGEQAEQEEVQEFESNNIENLYLCQSKK